MSLKSLLTAGAATLMVAPAPASPPPPSAGDARARKVGEWAADAAVAEARAEVVAEAQAETQATETGPVTISDVREGSRVHDTQGGLVGTIESVDESGAVVSTGRARAKLPFSSFGKNDRGLVISLTRAQLEAEVDARTPS